MERNQLVSITDFCHGHNIEISFVVELSDNGLIPTITHENNIFIEPSNLPQLERLVLMHYELDINLEGMETIAAMLEKVDYLTRRLGLLEQRLHFYEQDTSAGKN